MDERQEREQIEKWVNRLGASEGTAGESVGAVVARWAAKAGAWFGRHDVFRMVLQVPYSREDTRRLVESTLAIEDAEILESEDAEISALLAGGIGEPSPAVVTLRLREGAIVGGTEVGIRGIAVEGVVRQRGGQKAAERVAARITSVANLPH